MEPKAANVADEKVWFENLKSVVQRKKKVPKSSRLILSERDFEILKFINEMKFADVQTIHAKFFKVTKTGESSTSNRWARERLVALEQHGLLKRQNLFCDARAWYLVARRGWYLIRDRCAGEMLPRPCHSIDIRTFYHDRAVLGARLKFEREGKVAKWISERELLAGLGKELGFSSTFVPDAIIVSPAGERIAFEVEMSLKSKERYQDKVRSYVYRIRNPRSLTEGITKVHYLIFRMPVLRRLQIETSLFTHYFKLEEGFNQHAD